MRTSNFGLTVFLTFALMGSAAGEGLKLYPGAVKYTPPETEQNKQFADTVRPGTTITAYFTDDPFEKVLAFYRGLGKEYTSPNMKAEKLPDGQEVKKAFLIFDGAPDLVTSKRWASIRHPFIGSVTRDNGEPQYPDIRDVTEIVVTEKKPTEKKATEQKAAPQKPKK
jgi:hypothetical protein